MNDLSIFTLKVLRKLYTKIFGGYQLPSLPREEDPDKASDMIYNLLMQDKPCMIARFGSTELSAVINYLGIHTPKHSIIKYIKREIPEWWWDKNVKYNMQTCSGFFPPAEENLSRFSEMMLKDAKEVDILGSWLKQEWYLRNELIQAKKIDLEILNPFWSQKSWMRALQTKKVLVIHPFAQTIKKQYAKRGLLFQKSDILPVFELKTIKAVQSIGGNCQYGNWFEALDWMKNEMDKIDYDICLIGCGAYGFPLAAYAKRQGKKAVHIGGTLQLLFGIRGKRWEDSNYNATYNYSILMNDFWVKPSKDEKPQNANSVEGGCYW